jgi:hypothetical protein
MSIPEGMLFSVTETAVMLCRDPAIEGKIHKPEWRAAISLPCGCLDRLLSPEESSILLEDEPFHEVSPEGMIWDRARRCGQHQEVFEVLPVLYPGPARPF